MFVMSLSSFYFSINTPLEYFEIVSLTLSLTDTKSFGVFHLLALNVPVQNEL